MIACNFWLLALSRSARISGRPGSRGWGSKQPSGSDASWRSRTQSSGWPARNQRRKPRIARGQSIRHYLLLPGYEWGVSDWYLEVIRPFVKKYRPTVGFSPEEAERAAQVTVVGNPQNYPEDLLRRLQKAGC